jgi:hypothetical protein
MPLPYARVRLRLRRLQLSRPPSALYEVARQLTRDKYNTEYTQLRERALAKRPQLDEEVPEQAEALERWEAETARALAECRVLNDYVFGHHVLRHSDQIFAVARIAIHGLAVAREFRLAGIPANTTDIALDWSFETDVEADQQLDVQVALWTDRGDAGPMRLGLIKALLPPAAQAPEGHSELVPTANPAGTMRITCVAEKRVIAPPRPPRAARSTQETTGNLNVVAPRPIVFVELARIAGLFRPIAPAWQGPQYVQSLAYDGYTSADQDGRIFTSRDPAGDWTPYTQHIEQHARVIVPGLGASLGAVRDRLPRLTWRAVEDRDEPLVFSPFVHRDGHAMFDGALRGFADRAGQHRFQWQRAGEDNQVNGLTVDTDLAWAEQSGDAVGTARVRLYCPHVAGDRFRVQAGFAPSDAYQLFAAETGAMTMWKRIYVDYREMPTARALPIEKVPDCFDPACVELVFVRGQACEGRDRMVDSEDVALVEPELVRYMDQAFGVMRAGRFQLLAALDSCRRAEPQEGDVLRVDGGRLVDGTRRVTIEGNDNAGAFSLVRFEAPETSGDLRQRLFKRISLNLGNGLFYAADVIATEFVANRSRFWLEGHDLAHSFAACDGSVAASSIGTRRYFPGRSSAAPLIASGAHDDLSAIAPQAGGYPIANRDDVAAYLFGGAGGTTIPDGISPTRTVAARAWFAGRTVLFTRDPGYDESEVAQVVLIAHELTHAFGMPHKCGRHDLSTPRIALCNMNYPGTWLLVGDALTAGQDHERHDAQHCAHHVRALRDVRLEANRALGWGDG